MSDQSKCSHTDTKKKTLEQIADEARGVLHECPRYDRLIQYWRILNQISATSVYVSKKPIGTDIRSETKETNEALVVLRDQFDALKSIVQETNLPNRKAAGTIDDAGFSLYREASDNAKKWLEMVRDKAFDELDRIDESPEDAPHQTQECEPTKSQGIRHPGRWRKAKLCTVAGISESTFDTIRKICGAIAPRKRGGSGYSDQYTVKEVELLTKAATTHGTAKGKQAAANWQKMIPL